MTDDRGGKGSRRPEEIGDVTTSFFFILETRADILRKGKRGSRAFWELKKMRGRPENRGGERELFPRGRSRKTHN